MGLLKRLFLGRWFVRWLFRGGPWSIALKLAGAALWGAWRLRREGKRTERERRKLEIDADYEVVPERRVEPGSSARNPGGTPGYGPDNMSPPNERKGIHFDPREETS